MADPTTPCAPDAVTLCARCGYAAWRDSYPCNRCGGTEPRVYLPTGDDAVRDRDRWVRLFNRMDAAIGHHKRDKREPWRDEVDERLYAARDAVVRTAARGG